MKIGIDASALAQDNKSGVEWYTYHLLRHMAQQTFAVKVFLYVPKSLSYDVQLSLPSSWEIRVLQWPFCIGCTQLRVSLELLLHPIDVYFSPSYVPPLIHPKRTIITIHDLAVKTNPGEFSWRERFRQRIALWRTLHAASHICAVSQATRNDIVTYFPKYTTPITVTPLGVEEYYFTVAQDDQKKNIRHTYKLPPKYFLVLGRVTAKKNPQGAIQFTRAYREQTGEDVHVVFAGSIQEHTKNILLQDVPEWVHFLGYVQEHDVPTLLQEAQVLLFLSRKEGFGLPILQAYASGIPVVISDDLALKTIAGETGLVLDVRHMDITVQKLYALLSDTLQREQLKNVLRARGKAYTWNATACATCKVFTAK